MDFVDSSGEFGGERETVTEGEEGMPPVALRGLDIALDGAELEALIRAARARRERRGDMVLYVKEMVAISN